MSTRWGHDQSAQLTLAYVRSVLSYCPETGTLTWLPRCDDRRWTTRYAGKSAGNLHPGGYVKIKLCGRRYFAHQLIWLIETGKWPFPEIDHKTAVAVIIDSLT